MNRKTKKASAQVTNNVAAVEPELKKNQLQSISWNASTNLVRNDSMEGRKYLVVPMVMMVEGVHSGSNGPLYYPAEELGKTPEVWNHKPVVVYHPTRNGEPVSACSPEVLSSCKIGVIMNTKFTKDGRLKAEAWLDEDRVKEVDERVMNAILKKKPMELSTGLFTDNEVVEGEWEGEKYEAIARNYRPDHLAVLPDQIGACSMKDGAGFIRNELRASFQDLSDEEMEKARVAVLESLQKLKGNKKSDVSKLLSNEASFEQIREMLYKALAEKYPSDKGYACPWIEAVFSDHFIYCMGGKTFKLSYSTSGDGSVKLQTGDPSEVVRVIEYRTPPSVNTDSTSKPTTTNETKDTQMNKEQIVAELIANYGYSKEEKEELMGMDEKVLSKMLSAGKAVANKASKPAAEPAKVEAPAANKEAAPQSIDKVLSADQLQALSYGQRMLAENKRRLIETITGNAANRFSKEQLEKMDLDTLEAMAALAAKPVDANSPSATDYAPFAGGAPVPVGNVSAKDALVVEGLSWKK